MVLLIVFQLVLKHFQLLFLLEGISMSNTWTFVATATTTARRRFRTQFFASDKILYLTVRSSVTLGLGGIGHTMVNFGVLVQTFGRQSLTSEFRMSSKADKIRFSLVSNVVDCSCQVRVVVRFFSKILVCSLFLGAVLSLVVAKALEAGIYLL
jgi:hypothetical protein